MHWPHRAPPGTELERRLDQEVAGLADDHPRGFAVRLHVLGDFHSVGYVELWRQLLERHPALHIWGYTAYWDVEKYPIAVALKALRKQHPHPGRFEMRFSNAPETLAVRSTISVETANEVPAETILCPEQERNTESCSTCTLCWHGKKRIAFRQHWVFGRETKAAAGVRNRRRLGVIRNPMRLSPRPMKKGLAASLAAGLFWLTYFVDLSNSSFSKSSSRASNSSKPLSIRADQAFIAGVVL